MTSSKNIEKINPEEFLPTKEELEVSLVKYYNRILIAVEKQRKDADKLFLLQLLPMLGFNFIKQTPSVYYESKNIVRGANKRAKSVSALVSKSDSVKIEIQNEIAEIYKDYDNLVEDINLYNEQIEIYIEYEKILQIKNEQYKKMEISPIDHINVTIKTKEQAKNLKENFAKLVKLKNELFEKAKVNTHAFINKFQPTK
jgi:hypothetical protein